jgi:head-tail adaptor
MSGVQAYRRRAAETERTVDAAVAAVKAERAAEFEKSKREHAEKEAARRIYTREDIVGAGFVHDGHSWRKVVRVNKKTVSVETAYSWVDRIPFAKVRGIQQPIEGTTEDAQ